MEERGIVGPVDGAKTREILAWREQPGDTVLTGYGERTSGVQVLGVEVFRGSAHCRLAPSIPNT
jgi:hypothetical protein